jgi:hypothetical protein
MLRVKSAMLTGVISTLCAATAFAEFDVVPFVSNGKIFANAHDDGTNEDVNDVSVFGYEFGEDSLDPYFIGDPGFNSLGGTALPFPSNLNLKVVSDLKYWDGIGPVSLSAAPNGESLFLKKGSFNISIGSGTTVPLSLTIQPVDSLGGVHSHIESFLFSSDDEAIPNDGNDATDGIYFLQASISSSSPSITDSDPLWFVFNNGLSETQLNAAMSVVPEPSSIVLGMFAAGSLATYLRRQRSRTRRRSNLS